MKYRSFKLRPKKSNGRKAMMFRPFRRKIEREPTALDLSVDPVIEQQSKKLRRIVKRITGSPFIHVDEENVI
jgi:hypothetical protein